MFLQVGVEERGERAGAAEAGRAPGVGPSPAGGEPAGDCGRCKVSVVTKYVVTSMSSCVGY